MKLLAWILGLILVIALVVKWQTRPATDEPTMAEDPAKKAVASGQLTSSGSEKKRERKRVLDVLDQSLPEAPVRKSEPTARPQPQTVLVPEACEIRWRDIALQNSAELSNDLRDGHLALEGDCASLERTMLQQHMSDFDLGKCQALLANSKTKTSDGSKPENAKDTSELYKCKLALLYLRAAIMDRLFPDDDPAALSPQVLAGKILVKLPSVFGSPKQQAELLTLVDELTRKEPDLYAAHKAKVILLTFSGQGEADETRLREALETCREFGLNDAELDEVTIIGLLQQNKHELVEAEARRMLASNPQSLVARYYLASAMFRAGKRDEAISQLQVAQQMAPDDPRIKDTLEKARTAKPEDHIFTTSLSMTFDDLL